MKDEVLSFIKKNPGLTFRQLRFYLETNESTLNNNLNILLKHDLIRKTEDKRYWFPDPTKYDGSTGRGHLDLENGSYENEWKAQIPNEIKPGIYLSFMGIYEDLETNTTDNRRLLDWKEKEIKVI